MSAAQALHTFEKLTELGVHLGEDALGFARSLAQRANILDLEWPELSRILPDGGLPRGVTEIAAPHAHGGGTTLALAAIRAAQKSAQTHCAWIEVANGPKLYAPEVLAAGVDPARLLVVRAPREALSRVCVKVLATSAFGLVTVAHGAHEQARDLQAPGMSMGTDRKRGSHEQAREVRTRVPSGIDERAVRRFALAAEESAARVLLLTDTFFAHGPWPVALRLEVARMPETLQLRFVRDRRGRVGLGGQGKSIPLRTRPTHGTSSTREGSRNDVPLSGMRPHAALTAQEAERQGAASNDADRHRDVVTSLSSAASF